MASGFPKIRGPALLGRTQDTLGAINPITLGTGLSFNGSRLDVNATVATGPAGPAGPAGADGAAGPPGADGVSGSANALEIDNTPIVPPPEDFASQFIARIAAPGATRQALYETLIGSLVDAGVWEKLDCLYVLAAADRTTAGINLIESNYPLTEIGTPTFTVDHGFTGNGGSGGGGSMRLDSGFSPSAVGPAANLVRDSNSLFAWSNTSTKQSQIVGASGNGTTDRFDLYTRTTSDTVFTLNSAVPANGISVATGDGKGFYCGCRTSATAQAQYKNGVLNGSNSGASVSLSTVIGNLQILGFASWMSGHQCFAAGWGAGLDATENLALYDALHIYLQTVAGVA